MLTSQAEWFGIYKYIIYMHAQKYLNFPVRAYYACIDQKQWSTTELDPQRLPWNPPVAMRSGRVL